MNNKIDAKLMDRINKIKKLVRMLIKGSDKNQYIAAENFKVVNLIKLLLEQKKNSKIKEMEFPFTFKNGKTSTDKIKITGDSKGIYTHAKTNTTTMFIWYILPKHTGVNNNSVKKSSSKSKSKSKKP
jgi:hypothetical protein